MPYAATLCGITPLWSSEIEKYPLAVTKARFPRVKQLGDVTKINGMEIPPVDIITFGSPCQDLSVAGRRAGLAGERSGLFMEAIRIIKEMRDETAKRADEPIRPRYAVWENSNNEFAMSSRKFFTEVTKKLPEKVRGGSGMFYTKIHLTDYAKTFLPRKNYSIEDFK